MDLTKGPLRRQMIVFAFPMILTSVFKQSLSFADTLIVARFCSPGSLSAISLASTLYSLLASFTNGFGAACSVIIGKAVGSKQDKTVKDTACTLILFGSGLSLLLALACSIYAPYYVQWIDAPEEIIGLTAYVLRLYSFDIFFYGISLVCACLLNGSGDSGTPFRISTSSSLLNILLDLIAVAVFRAGVIGCVITTLISQIVSAVWMMFCLIRRMRPIHTRISPRLSILREAFSIGSTTIAQEALFNLLAMLAQSIVAPLGVDYINGYSIGRQIFSIFSTAVNGYIRAYSTALAHNYGAREYARIREARRLSQIDGNILCLTLAALSIAVSRPLSRLIFADASRQAIAFAMTYTVLSSPMYFASLHTQRASSMLRVCKRNKLILASSAITMLVKAVCLYLISSISIYLLPLADVISKTAAFIYLRAEENKAVAAEFP